MPDQREIARYYDSSTRLMLLFGRRRKSGAIHRELWGPGVRDREEALRYSDTLIADRIAPIVEGGSDRPQVYDLGCGVGATALYLAAKMPLQVTGVTLSGAQAAIAAARAAELGLSDRCRFEARSYLETGARDVDAAYATESFIHAPDARDFFAAVSAMLRPGGRLFVVDDFLAEEPQEAESPDPSRLRRRSRRERIITLFKEGWRVNSLLPVQDVVRIAANTGLACDEVYDLTRFVARDPGARVAAGMLARFLPWSVPYARNFAGDSALQICIREGWTRYALLSFTRTGG
ncbi:SAM-dependent methyltransferase [Salinispira pacifica]